MLELLGDPEVTANLCCNFAYLLGRLRDLQYIFAVTSGSPSSYYLFSLLPDFEHGALSFVAYLLLVVGLKLLREQVIYRGVLKREQGICGGVNFEPCPLCFALPI